MNRITLFVVPPGRGSTAVWAREHGDYDARSDISMSKVSLLAHKQEVQFVYNIFFFLQKDKLELYQQQWKRDQEPQLEPNPLHSYHFCTMSNYDTMMEGLMIVSVMIIDITSMVTGKQYMHYAPQSPVHASWSSEIIQIACSSTTGTRNTPVSAVSNLRKGTNV
mmetsp:Transcript_15192/g.28568  ORF Transcript_15192/g.28568 Transcript_15192/m.28568 type:complete len:164 (+) Transcript_15192:277-768(+)